MEEAVARKLWLETVERVKDQTIHPSLWRALEASHGITMDGEVFVVGFSSADAPQAGLLRSSEHRSIIEKTLGRLLGKSDVRLRTIEGTTLADYEHIKQQEAIFDSQRKLILEKKAQERATEKSWDHILELVSRMYASTHLRQLPHIRARYMRQALEVVADVMDDNYPKNPDDVAERALARVIDKIATLIEAPPVYVANELNKMIQGRGTAAAEPGSVNVSGEVIALGPPEQEGVKDPNGSGGA